MAAASFNRSVNLIPTLIVSRGEFNKNGSPTAARPLLLSRWNTLIRSERRDLDLYYGRNNEAVQASRSNSSSPPVMVASPAVTSLALSPKRSKKNVCLFFCEEMRNLAELIAMESDAIELRNIDWRNFEDGFPNLFISNAHGIRGQHVSFLASFSSPGVIFEQLSIIYALPRLFVSSFTVVLPFFPTGSYERMEEEGDVATAFTLARILSNIPISRGGPSSLVIFDIHALQERFYFGDNVLPCFESGMPLLKNRLQQLPDSDNISIAFPDDGSWKRFHKQLQHFPVIVCTKVREGDRRFVRLKEGDPKGRHVVIVDDFVQSGGTLIECQKVLAAHGAAKISAYVTHGIFPNKTWQRFKYDDGARPQNPSFSCFRPQARPQARAPAAFFFLLRRDFFGQVKLWCRACPTELGSFAFSSPVPPPATFLRLTEISRACISFSVRPTAVSPEKGMRYFWITDSCPHTVNAVKGIPPFEVLSLAGSIADALQI